MLVDTCHPADRGARIAPNTVIEDDIEDASVRAGAALRPFGCPSGGPRSDYR